MHNHIIDEDSQKNFSEFFIDLSKIGLLSIDINQVLQGYDMF